MQPFFFSFPSRFCRFRKAPWRARRMEHARGPRKDNPRCLRRARNPAKNSKSAVLSTGTCETSPAIVREGFSRFCCCCWWDAPRSYAQPVVTSSWLPGNPNNSQSPRVIRSGRVSSGSPAPAHDGIGKRAGVRQRNQAASLLRTGVLTSCLAQRSRRCRPAPPTPCDLWPLNVGRLRRDPGANSGNPGVLGLRGAS